MKTVLTQYHKEEILQSLIAGDFSVDHEIQKLVKEGFDDTSSRNLILQVLKEYRYELFQRKLSQQKNEEKKKLSYFVLLMISITGPVFNIGNLLWYLLACVVAGAAGYYGQADKPIAGMLGGVLLVIVFPLTYSFYMSGRHSYFNVELLIPVLMAAVPAWLLQLFVGKIFYDKDEMPLNS
ncbi:MAG: hypothetical protein ABIQ88_20380 [Chitinophagaceae bacterium]